MRILGLDFGSKTVGVAVSDELLITAQGVEIVRRKSPSKLRQTLARIEEIIAEYKVDRIVLGYPKNMNNTEGERCEKTKQPRCGRQAARRCQFCRGRREGRLHHPGPRRCRPDDPRHAHAEHSRGRKAAGPLKASPPLGGSCPRSGLMRGGLAIAAH